MVSVVDKFSDPSQRMLKIVLENSLISLPLC